MNPDPRRYESKIFGQTRTLLILTVLMMVLSDIIDPPVSTLGAILSFLSVFVLLLVIVLIQRSISRSKSSSSNPYNGVRDGSKKENQESRPKN